MRVDKRSRRNAKSLFRSCLVDGTLDGDRVRRVVETLVSANQRECPAILSHFGRLVKLELARCSATVETASPLPADLQAAVEASLKRRYGAALSVAFTRRPDLIGGMRIQVGSDVYDGSVLAGLAALERSF